MKTIRCAVYTRKSSEEGLDQAFNSLDAQREAGLDYIKSQKHQGWSAVPDTFDDGGYSGGTTDRPGLQRLLAAIDAGRIDVVVVYKVDRLSRSLADFARLMQLFDEKRVSFVSVTQQFNTTTSMGRLTLNMLLSFAQFEREVAGERIRDKIAATKRRGVWIGGRPPMGYQLDPAKKSRVLQIVPEEAAIIRLAYAEYLKTGSLIAVMETMRGRGHVTRRWTSDKGRTHGGNPIDAAMIYRYLTNPVYIGKIAHTRRASQPVNGQPEFQTDLHDGLHEPIIDRATWDRVQAKMTVVESESRARHTGAYLLLKKLKTHDGWTMTSSQVPRRVTRNGVRSTEPEPVRYYISRKGQKLGARNCEIKRINSSALDALVRALVADHLRARHGAELPESETAVRDARIRDVIERVVIAPDSLTIELARARLEAALPHLAQTTDPDARDCRFEPSIETNDRLEVLTLRMKIKRLSNRITLVSPDGHDLLTCATAPPDPAAPRNVARAIGQAYLWHRELLRTGEPVEQLADREGVSKGLIYKLLRLTQLGPEKLKRCLLGPGVGVGEAMEAASRVRWEEQGL